MSETFSDTRKSTLERICVYCASSTKSHPEYRDSARETGRLLAEHGSEIIYGGGSVGSMGALADGALEAGGSVTGVLPEFMDELEWSHKGLTELQVVSTMHQRKQQMIENSDGIIALPGGSGTFEELMEALTWKRLALYRNPIVLLNTRGYFDAFQAMMEQASNEHFMHCEHLRMWITVSRPSELVPALLQSDDWNSESLYLAVQ